MSNRQRSEQEIFWQGQFGNDYTGRNQKSYDNYEGREAFFAGVLEMTEGVRSVCELGANAGQNLQVLQRLEPRLALTGVEINELACRQMNRLDGVRGVRSSIQDFRPDDSYDLIFTCGVLIHLDPDALPAVYERMVESSSRYILVNEYYNPTPAEIDYRGHSSKLFKRDFAGELLDTFPDLSVVNYGFLWKRLHPSWDDTTWVLLEKA